MTNHGYTTPSDITTGIDALINRPMSHPPEGNRALKVLYASTIAAELTHLATLGPLLTPDVLLRRAAYLRAGIQTEEATA